MEITGIGVDIENIDKFKNKEYKKNKNFYCKIFSANEINYCLTKTDSCMSFAGKFCAKEAIAKALKKNNLFSLANIEIINNEAGQPEAFMNAKKIDCFLSIAHGDAMAIAFCVLYT